MDTFEIIMPKMGESILEATITKWFKAEGDAVEEEEPVVEIATDKVDTEIPSAVQGRLSKILFKEGETVKVGEVIAIIETDMDIALEGEGENDIGKKNQETQAKVQKEHVSPVEEQDTKTLSVSSTDYADTEKFYSPLVKNIAHKENLSLQELDSINGSGKDGRVTKDDILNYLNLRKPGIEEVTQKRPSLQAEEGDRIIEMSRVRKLIAEHMVLSKKTSPHVTSFIDVDVSNLVNWRNRIKDSFFEREGEKITYTPIFIKIAAEALKEYPGINASVYGTKIIQKKAIHIGMATALPDGNLIVPVIRNADRKNLLGLVKSVNDLAQRARNHKLLPDEIQNGTFSITNFGTFDNLSGTPIINQPQVAILGVGAIRKKALVIEAAQGDMIAIRQVMILSLSYDHRVVDGALAGMYLKKVKELLENFDPNQNV